MCSFFGAVSASTITRRNTDRRSGLLGSVVFPANRSPLRRRGNRRMFRALAARPPVCGVLPAGAVAVPARGCGCPILPLAGLLRLHLGLCRRMPPSFSAHSARRASGFPARGVPCETNRETMQAVFRHGAFPAKQTARLPAFLHRSFSLCALGPQYKRFPGAGRSLRNDPRDRPLSCIGPFHSAHSARSTSGSPARAVPCETIRGTVRFLA